MNSNETVELLLRNPKYPNLEYCKNNSGKFPHELTKSPIIFLQLFNHIHLINIDSSLIIQSISHILNLRESNFELLINQTLETIFEKIKSGICFPFFFMF